MSFRNVYNYDGFSMHHSLDEKPNPRRFASHCHTVYEIMYIHSGSGKFMIEGTSAELSGGTVALISPCRFHCVTPSENISYERYVIAFSPDDLPAPCAERLKECCKGADVYISENELAYPVGNLFEKLEFIGDKCTENKGGIASSVLSEIVWLIISAKNAEREKSDDSLGARVIKYLDEKITSKITLDDIAKEFFVSKSYLCRTFKEYSGVSVLGYINSKKVALARQLIENGETASVAAYSVGFCDYSTFFRAYKRSTGKTPTHKNATGKGKNN